MKESNIRELEGLSDRSMPGSVRHEIGDWVLRSGLRSTGRANSVWIRGDPGASVVSAIDEVEEWYQNRGTVPIFQIFDGADPAVTAELDSRGYQHRTGAVVMIADLERINSSDSAIDSVTMAVSTSATPAFASLVDDADRVAEMVATTLQQRFITVADAGGVVIGGGLGIVDREWVGVFAMQTQPWARRQGVAGRVLSEIVESGRLAGATRIWLQVMPDNEAARSLYNGVGFVDAHQYQYRHLPNLLARRQEVDRVGVRLLERSVWMVLRWGSMSHPFDRMKREVLRG